MTREQVTPAPPEGITLRAMRASDLARVRTLHHHLLPVSYPAAFFIQLLVSPRRLCLVAIEDNVIVGFASAAMGLLQPSAVGGPDDAPANQDSPRFHPGISRSHVTLLTLGVLPAHRRRGIGRSLVHGVIQRLEESCSPTAPDPYTPSDRVADKDNKTAVLVQVQVAPSNFAGKCFYTHLGMMDQQISDDPRFHLGPGSQSSVMAGVLSV